MNRDYETLLETKYRLYGECTAADEVLASLCRMGVGGSPPPETAKVYIGQLQSRQEAAEQMKDVEAKLAVMRKDGVVRERLEPGGGGDLEGWVTRYESCLSTSIESITYSEDYKGEGWLREGEGDGKRWRKAGGGLVDKCAAQSLRTLEVNISLLLKNGLVEENVILSQWKIYLILERIAHP